jgi:FkbM family methyltransferase
MAPQGKSFRIFDAFEPWHGIPPDGLTSNFVGQFTDPKFFNMPTRTDLRPIGPGLPMANEAIFEWMALLHSVLGADQTFTMVELGAGFGRWLIAGVCAARRKRPELKPCLIAVEAEPTHFAWLHEHFRANGVDPRDHTLIYAAVNATGESVYFTVGHPAEWYGQSIIDPGQPFGDWPNARVVKINAVTIRNLLRPLDYVDLVDMDIQGAERECIAADISPMTQKVHRAFVATHSEQIHQEVGELFRRAGWRCEHAFCCGKTEQTLFGAIEFQDGVQSWVNPRLDRRRGRLGTRITQFFDDLFAAIKAQLSRRSLHTPARELRDTTIQHRGK